MLCGAVMARLAREHSESFFASLSAEYASMYGNTWSLCQDECWASFDDFWLHACCRLIKRLEHVLFQKPMNPAPVTGLGLLLCKHAKAAAAALQIMLSPETQIRCKKRTYSLQNVSHPGLTDISVGQQLTQSLS